jgi:hypothetical protein
MLAASCKHSFCYFLVSSMLAVTVFRKGHNSSNAEMYYLGECSHGHGAVTGLWHLVPVRYRTKGKLSLFLLSLTRRGGERRGVHVPYSIFGRRSSRTTTGLTLCKNTF